MKYFPVIILTNEIFHRYPKNFIQGECNMLHMTRKMSFVDPGINLLFSDGEWKDQKFPTLNEYEMNIDLKYEERVNLLQPADGLNFDDFRVGIHSSNLLGAIPMSHGPVNVTNQIISLSFSEEHPPDNSKHDSKLESVNSLDTSTESIDDEDNNITIGSYTKGERRIKIMRYKKKRANRSFIKKIKYKCRKLFADNRPRMGGRFITIKKKPVDDADVLTVGRICKRKKTKRSKNP